MLRNTKVRSKLLLALGIPCVALAYFVTENVRASWQVSAAMRSLDELITFGVAASELAHELQKERGMTVGFVASGGRKFAAELPAQRAAADSKHVRLTRLSGSLRAGRFGAEFVTALGRVATGMGHVASIRRAVDGQAAAPAAVLATYTAAVDDLIGVNRFLTQLSPDSAVTRELTAYVALLGAKERAGRLRAVVNNALAADRFTGELFVKFVSTDAEQGPFLERFVSFASPAHRAFHADRMRDPSVAEVDRIRAVAYTGADGRALGVSPDAWYAAATTKINLLKAVEDRLARDVRGHASRLAAAAQTRLVVSLAAGVLAVVASVLLGFTLVRQLVSTIVGTERRVEQLRAVDITNLGRAIEALARGELDTHVEYGTPRLAVETRDEIGALAESVNGIIDQTAATVRAFQDAAATLRGAIGETNSLVRAARAGRLGERADAAAYAGGYQELVAGLNATMDAVSTPLGEARSVLERVAERDLTARMTGQYEGEYASIERALNVAVENLEVTLAQVSSAAEQVAAAGTQITGGSQSLAHGASEQAASLEEIAASLQELTATARQSAENAGEARGLAEETRARAGDGVARMERLSEAMGEIKRSTSETAKILKTIDEIAFQTNLLALNAAVEAARAGDAGRGFAVVAEEVRALAIRSAEAAKSTARLIDQSAQSTDRGVALNAEVLRSLGDIHGQVERVVTVVAEIAAAGEQQAQGVTQINDAVDQVNGVTQQVAANAEESASAAEELASQSKTLSGMVGQFRLSEDPGGTSDAAAPWESARRGPVGSRAAVATPRRANPFALR